MAEAMSTSRYQRLQYQNQWIDYLYQAYQNVEEHPQSPHLSALTVHVPWESYWLRLTDSPIRENQTSPSLEDHYVSSENIAEYKYSPLADQFSMRLLVIEAGSTNAPLLCKLQNTSLQTPGPYEAISYVWGNEGNLGSVICHEQRLPITRNLEDALRRIRLKDRPRVVWADAICIDQQNVQERGHQVKLMQQIYSRASRVLVWLGHDVLQHSESAFDMVERIYRFARKEATVMEARIPLPDDATWRVLASLFGCTWFWRLWVIQEITSAPTGLVMWGDNEIQWTKIGLTAEWFRATGYEIMQYTPMAGVYNACLMYGISEEARKGRAPPSFIELMMLTRQFQSTDHRDRVYSLLGLPHLEKDSKGDTWSIQPDYTKTVEQVYLELAQKSLVYEEELIVLSGVHHEPILDRSEEIGLPSWVPRWESRFIQRLVPEGPKYNASIGLSNPRANFATSNIISTHDFRSKWMSSSPLVLSLPGFEFDITSSLSETFDDSSRMPLWEQIMVTWSNLVEPLQNHTGASVRDEDLNMIFHEALTAGKDWYGVLIDPKENFKDFVSFFGLVHSEQVESHRLPRALGATSDRFERYWKGGGRLRNEELDLSEMLSSLEATSIRFKLDWRGFDYRRFVDAAKNSCVGRKLFVTAKGYISIGPAAMLSGDRVCILAGGIVPFILRKKGENYRLIGEAYVPGIMRGEAVEEWKKKGVSMDVFEIR